MTVVPPDPRLDDLLAGAVVAAHAGGRVVRDAFAGREHANAQEKSPGDWVSDVDTASERAVRAALRSAFPEVPVVGEEEGGEAGERYWLVDPLDGTANFLHGLAVVGVSVALVEDGSPVVGVVHAPMLDETFAARLGGGTTHDGVPVRVSDRAVASAICATGFPFRKRRHRVGEYLPVFERALVTFEDLRRAGAATLDLAWTAAGVFDGFFEQGLGPWDVAAGALLVREAGGVVTDWSGDDRAWLVNGDVLAAPPGVHECLLGLATS